MKQPGTYSTTRPPLGISLALVATLWAATRFASAQTTSIGSLDVHQTVQENGQPRANRSAGDHPLTLAGKVYTDGLGTIAPSRLVVRLNKNGVRFSATAGVDDEVGKGRGKVVFKLLGHQNKILWQSPEMSAGDPPRKVDVDLKGLEEITLVTEGDPGHDQDNHADWAEAKVDMHSAQYKVAWPNTVPVFKEEAVILTPRPGPAPRITGAKVFGVRPGHPVLHTLTATGERPMSFSVENLPDGLRLDTATGRISGTLLERREHRLTVRATNAHGNASRPFRIICGDVIGLVPAMGWNSWNCFADQVTGQNIRDAADAMVKSGLADHGWTYVNIDEGWSMLPSSKDPAMRGPARDATGRILPNPKFPDMQGLVDHIHGLGLKAGIYTSPGPLDCGGYTGSYQHEDLDARRFAEWGFDYLKYDVCSYNDVFKQRTRPGPENTLTKPMDPDSREFLDELRRPWLIMRAALNALDRDIIYSISGNVRNWGSEVGANSWRTSSDIVDSWLETVSGWRMSVSEIGFDRFRDKERIGWSGPELAGPGHFNDRDMLVVGHVGWGPPLHPTRLTPNEQYTHVSLWCLLASPLIIGGDLTKLDGFTLGLLSNDEVLEVNQDPLAREAVRVGNDGDLEVWAKDMEDGSKAVGLFNRGYLATEVTAGWKQLGISGPRQVRDLWRQKDLGVFDRSFKVMVPRHGVVLVRIAPAK